MQTLQNYLESRSRTKTLLYAINIVLWAGLLIAYACLLTGNGHHPAKIYTPANEALSSGIYVFNPLPEEEHNVSSFGVGSRYTGPPRAALDDAWQIYEVAKYVRLSEEEAQQLANPTAELHVGGGYIMLPDVFHQIHCLDYIRMTLFSDHYNLPRKNFQVHQDHCINDLRQAITCASDITPIPYQSVTTQGKPAYKAQTRVRHTCTNFDRVLEWAQARALIPEIGIENLKVL